MGGERPDWLPAGWKIRVKVRLSGKKDKYYVNTSKGLKFSSKPEVLRYLKSSTVAKESKPKRANERYIEKIVDKKLPSGWIKEVRPRKMFSKTKTDSYYIDPVSGRVFRSMKEVFLFLASKDLGDQAKSKRGNRDHSSMELGDRSKFLTGDAKGQGSAYKKAAGRLTGKPSVKSGTRHAIGLKGDSMETVRMPVEQRKENKTPIVELSDKTQLVHQVEKRAPDRMDGVKISAGDIVYTRSKTRDRLKVKKLNMPLEEHGDNEHCSASKNLPEKLPEVNSIEPVTGGRRRSLRLAGRKQEDTATHDQFLPSGSGGTAKKTVSMLVNHVNISDEKEDNSSSCQYQQQKHENKNPPRINKTKRTPNSKRKASNLPGGTSKRRARAETVFTSPSPEIKPSNQFEALSATPPPAIESEVTDVKNSMISKAGTSDKPQIDIATRTNSIEPKNVDSSLDDLLMDPCIEFAVKTLTGTIPIEEANKVGEISTPSSHRPASGNMWADPCFEFAVKMLTGEVPLHDSPIQEAVKKNPSLARAVNGVSSHDSGQ